MRAEVYRSGFSQGLAVVIVLAALASVVAMVAGERSWLPVGVPAAVFAAVGGWALFWRPSVILDDDGVRIVNVVRTVAIGWPAVTSVRASWSLEVATAARTWTAWAAPRGSTAGRVSRRVRHQEEPSGASAEVVAAAIERLLPGRSGDPVPESVTWHRWTIVALSVSAVLAVVGMTIR